MNEFSTVAALRAADPTQVTASSPVVTDGYYGLGDGGGATFRLLYSAPNNGADTRPADDGGSIIRSATAGYYFARYLTGPVTFRSFGARGDFQSVAATATISAGSNVLTIQSAPFSSADVGKVINVPGAGTLGVTGAATQSAGSGYAVGDTVTLAGGTLAGGGQAAILVLESYGWSVQNPGSYATAPSNPAAVGSTTSKSGSGATFTLAIGANALRTTVSGFVSSTQVTLNTGATTAVGSQGVTLSYGTDDTLVFARLASYANGQKGGVDFCGRAGDVHYIWPQANYPYQTLPSLITLSVPTRWSFNGAQLFTDNSFNPNDFDLVFSLQSTPSFYCDGLNLQCPNYNFADTVDDDIEGPVAYYLSGACTDTVIRNHTQRGGRHGLRCEDPMNAFYYVTAGRARGITLENAYFDSVYYPMNFEGSGDQFVGRNIKAHGCGRTYFTYNVRDHDVEIESDHGGPFMDCLLKCYCASGADKDPSGNSYNATYNMLSNVRLSYTNIGRANKNASQAWVSFEFEQIDAAHPASGTIKDIEVRLDCEVTSFGMPNTGIVTYKFLNDTQYDNTGRGHVFENVKFSGQVKGANYGQAVADLFDPQYGTWTGDTIRNVRFEDFTVDGSQSSFSIDATAITSGLVLDGVAGTVPLTIANAQPDVVDLRSVNLPNMQANAYGIGTYPTVAGNTALAIPMNLGARGYRLVFDGVYTQSGANPDTISVTLGNQGSGDFPSGYVSGTEIITFGTGPAQSLPAQNGTTSFSLMASIIGNDSAGGFGEILVIPGQNSESTRLSSKATFRSGSYGLLTRQMTEGYIGSIANQITIHAPSGFMAGGRFRLAYL